MIIVVFDGYFHKMYCLPFCTTSLVSLPVFYADASQQIAVPNSAGIPCLLFLNMRVLHSHGLNNSRGPHKLQSCSSYSSRTHCPFRASCVQKYFPTNYYKNSFYSYVKSRDHISKSYITTGKII